MSELLRWLRWPCLVLVVIVGLVLEILRQLFGRASAEAMRLAEWVECWGGVPGRRI